MVAYFAVQGVQINIVNGDGYHIFFSTVDCNQYMAYTRI